jgi:nifR3 family TIM-barrel protein
MTGTPGPIHPVRIGTVPLARNLLLAPMHEHTHLALRLLCRREGAALAYTEMATPEDLLAPPSEEEVRRHPEAARPGALSHKAGNLLASAPEDRPLGVQLLPRLPGPVAECIALLASRGRADLVDLNFACPSRRVVASGRGGAMLRKARTALRIVEAAVGASRLPVTLKIRLGFTASAADSQRALDIAREAARRGIAALTLHARTVGQGYGGRADWPAIGGWAGALAPLPVFGSGDLRSPEAVLEMLRVTGCAGASIARGALGAPWIFRQAIALAAAGTYEPAGNRERREAALAHFDGLARQYGEAAAVKFMRRFGQHYARGMPKAAAARAEFQACRTTQALRATVEKWFGGP